MRTFTSFADELVKYLPKFNFPYTFRAMLKIVQGFIQWTITWMYFVSLICLIGAGGGVLTHVMFALIFRDQPDLGYYAAFGYLNGLNYGGVWAGGAAIVLCVLRARKEYLAAHPVEAFTK